MQHQLLTQETPLIAGSSIIERKDIINLSDVEVQHELQSLASQLAKSRKNLEAAQTNHRQMEAYTRELLASASEREDVKIPAGYQKSETTAVTILGGADGLELFYRKYRGLIEDAIIIDQTKLQEKLIPLVQGDKFIIDIPAKVERRPGITFDWETLATTPAPEPVIEPQVVHEPMIKLSTVEENDPKA